MRQFIVTLGQRLITFAVAFGLLNTGASRINTNYPLSTQARYASNSVLAAANSFKKADASHDDTVWLEGLGHNSRDLLYRTPGGPVATGTSVTLRLRAASGDLTAARVYILNDRTNTISIREMTLVADDGTYEWWQAILQGSSLPTVYWYRFIAIDGSDMKYYADDSERLGGWGSPSEEEVDYGWQLTFYDPAFHTPDWIKTAIIYQILPDRFRDGNSGNNPPIGSLYYGTNSTIFRSNTSYWNKEICDPRDEDGACPGVFGENFYGGDLQGVINKLDYLDQLGVTAIYLNPIFRSPSNHGYDTTNYQVIDENIGDLTLFTILVSQAAARGIFVILDGVFNYTSSDSVYFDRYRRFGGDGACETLSSYYRSWFYFYDVAPGTGPCINSLGTANSADYISFLGNDYLPLLNSMEERVQEQFWKEGTTSIHIGPLWVGEGRADGWRLDTGSEIDPGVLSNPNNEYWEGFRAAIHAVNPNAYIVGEEWGNSTSWTLGSEWDGSSNYQLSTAILGFWRHEPFIDSDHNPSSPAGIIEPLLPSQLNERLLNLQERYAPEALAAMMNLLDSHNTNRALFMLDHNTDQNNTSLYWNPTYNWSDAITRLRGAVLLQMTLPGAPTIYYGDEVGLVGPVTFDTETNMWQDDPYNRQPYPWVGDECDQIPNCGTPYYSFLSQSNQEALRNYYTLLTTTRNTHPALQTGSFDPLVVDDINMIYAFGRRMPEASDAVIVVLNRGTQNKTVAINLGGYIAAGSFLSDVLHSNAEYIIAQDGTLTVTVPAMSGVLLVLISGNIIPPATPLNLFATEGESQVTLIWNAVPGTDEYTYHIFRSIVPGGGYEEVGSTDTTNYIDTSVVNGTQYYYVVRTADSLGVVSENSLEVSALPHWNLDWVNLQSPAEFTHTIGLTPTDNFLGQVFIENATSQIGATSGLVAQVGYGPADADPADWSSWTDAPFESDQGDNDQFACPLLPEEVGDFQVVYRYSTTNGRDWIYADLSGVFVGTPTNPGILHVLPSDDVTPPATPGNLLLVDWGDHHISMAWNPVTGDTSLFAYDVYRSTSISSVGNPIARVMHPSTEFTDTQVVTGMTYYYRVQAVDSSFNRSALSNQITASPVTRQITVTFNVVVPEFTEGSVYITGDHPKLGSWDPGKIALTKVGENTWSITLTFEEGVLLTYKFTRGNYAWLDVETAGDGNTAIPNRRLLVEADSSGVLVVNSTVANWRDPLVAASFPTNNATEVSIIPTITVTWNQAMLDDTALTLTGPEGPIPGNFTYDPSTWTVSFIPSVYLQLNTYYTIRAFYQTDAAGDPQLVNSTWFFTTAETMPIFTIVLPILNKP